MKRLLIAVILLCGASTLSAQQPWKKQLNFDIGPQFPSGDFATANDLGTAIGFSGTFYYQLLTRYTFISASVGYHDFKLGESDFTVNVVPIQIGVRYNFTLTGVQPYVGLEWGPYLLSSNVSGSSDDTEFGVMPKVGVRIPIVTGFDFDASLKHSIIFTADPSFSFTGINGGIAYTIE